MLVKENVSSEKEDVAKDIAYFCPYLCFVNGNF